jgi:electron transport complex protein RnfD
MDAAIVVATCLGSAIIFEAVIQRLANKPVTVSDGSAALTGLLLGLNLPAGCPIYVCLVGSLVAVGLAKAVFGGLGYNPFNPALTARVFLLIAFPVALTTWPLTRQQTAEGPPDKYFSVKTTWKDQAGRKLPHTRKARSKVDVVTAATPLAGVKDHWKKGTLAQINHMKLFLGNQPGCIGEIAAVALLLGGLVLVLLGYITWHIPVAYIMTVGVIAAIANGMDPEQYAGPLFHVLAGGLMLGAIYMATDYVTSPVYPKGKILFGIGCGALTMLIRLWGGYPEGVSFAILLMNAVTPLIDRVTRPKKYGLQTWLGSEQRG